MRIESITRASGRSNDFVAAEDEGDGAIRLAAGSQTNWFTNPDGTDRSASAPVLWFEPPKTDFVFGATVRVDLAATFDAAGLAMRCGADWWAKLVYELTPMGAPTIVSVVSSPVSDDANGPEPSGDSVDLRVMRKGGTVAMHWRASAGPWHLVRYSALPSEEPVEVGLTVQSPTGEGLAASFRDGFMEAWVPEDIRSGS
ncbi:MAG: DUF1349 domain-containing protein [Myxococcota bacterium]|nr:DUF1349 domain-containing protein [Myxococcota bacterium]